MKLLTPAVTKLAGSALLLCLATSVAASKPPETMPPAKDAQPQQELTAEQRALADAIEQFIIERTLNMNGDVSVHVVPPTRDVPFCDSFNIVLPPGRGITSRTTLEVSCPGNPDMPITFVRADVKVEGEYYVPSQTIEINQEITADLLKPQKGDLLRLPEGTQTDLNSLVGRTAAHRLTAGRPIKASATRGADAIARGQVVQVQVVAPGLIVTNQGEALTNAEVGAPVQVKTVQGKVVRGIARPGGIVELSM